MTGIRQALKILVFGIDHVGYLRVRQVLVDKHPQHIKVRIVRRFVEVLSVILQPHVQDCSDAFQVLQPYVLGHFERCRQNLLVSGAEHVQGRHSVSKRSVCDQEYLY